MIKAILIDDEPRGVSALRQMLQSHCPDVQIIATCGSASEGLTAIRRLRPDIVFLDIVMPGQNAMDMLGEMEQIPFEVIFVTAHSDYMIQAFRFSAVDYLLKPVDEDLLIEAVARARVRLSQKTTAEPIQTLLHNLSAPNDKLMPRICIPSIKGFHVLELDDILYIEALGNYSRLHLCDGQQLTTSRSIVDYENLLHDLPFCRIHKSYIVNLKYVTEYQRGEGGMVHLTSGKWLEVSRRRKEAFLTRVRTTFRS